MTNGDVAAFSACIAIFFIFVAVLVYVIIDHKKQTADHPSGDDFEHQVRIVELENGTYIIQVWEDWRDEWETPFGPHHFNTLDEAKKEKERRIEGFKRDAGYRFKRVVD
jgi:hypothetical protein